MISPWIYSQGWVRSIGQGGTTSVDAHADAADEVAETDGEASPEQGVAGEDVRGRVELLNVGELVQLGGEDDGHDDAVDGHDLAEDDGDQVLGPYPGRLDTSADDRDARRPDAPACVSPSPCDVVCRRTMRTLRRRDRCTARCPNSPMCRGKRFRETVRPGRCYYHCDRVPITCAHTLKASPSFWKSMSVRR